MSPTRTETGLAPAVERIAAAVSTGDAGDIVVDGTVVALGSASAKERLGALERVLYERFHAGRPASTHAGTCPDERFRDELELAVRVPWTTEEGWRVLRAQGERVDVQRSGLRLRLDRSRHVAPGSLVDPGREIGVRMPATRPGLSPGYFTVLSPAGGPVDGVGRLYLNLPSASAPAFLERLTDALRAPRARWAVKTLSDPGAYGRRDGTVIYVEAATRDLVAERTKAALDALPVPARADIPPLTLPLAPELGYADEPVARHGRGLSFGQHRMNAIARALLRSRMTDPDSRLRRLRAGLLRAGIDPIAPYRNRPEGGS